MHALAVLIAAAPVALALYAYIGYPIVLRTLSFRRRTRVTAEAEWPTVTITVPVYNAAASIRTTLDHLLRVDYPRERLQILVISDASTVATDDIVRSFAANGVELLRLPTRQGKTVAENMSLSAARGDILVNVDSTIIVPPQSLKTLVRAFDDPTVGVASGSDVSAGDAREEGTSAESGYVGYEMWVRDLETRVGSIVGASGCFYGARRSVHERALPGGLSWDFASALNARKQGYRSVSVPDATCIVPRTIQVRTELTRKVRTMARGLSTLFFYRELMNPFRYGSFAFMLISHKLVRWLPYLLAPLAYASLALLAVGNGGARVIFGFVSAGILAGALGIYWREPRVQRILALPGFVVAVFWAGFLAWWTALRQAQLATWEPTVRPEVQT